MKFTNYAQTFLLFISLFSSTYIIANEREQEDYVELHENIRELEIVPGYKMDVTSGKEWLEYTDLVWPGNGPDIVLKRSMGSLRVNPRQSAGLKSNSPWLYHIPIITLGTIYEQSPPSIASTCQQPGKRIRFDAQSVSPTIYGGGPC